MAGVFLQASKEHLSGKTMPTGISCFTIWLHLQVHFINVHWSKRLKSSMKALMCSKMLSIILCYMTVVSLAAAKIKSRKPFALTDDSYVCFSRSGKDLPIYNPQALYFLLVLGCLH